MTNSQCPHPNNHFYSAPKGRCEQFNQPARTFHIQTNDCILNFATAEEQEEPAEEIFSTEIVWVDRDGYPMGEDTPENAYFNLNFVTSPDEPF